MLTQAESIRVARLILDKFDKWADDSMSGYEDIPFNKESNKAKIEALEFAKANLARIIRDVTEIKE